MLFVYGVFLSPCGINILSDTTTPQLTRLRPSIGNDRPWTLVPRLTNAGIYSRTTTQQPSTPTTALPVRISSFSNGTPETGNSIHKQKPPLLIFDWQPSCPPNPPYCKRAILFGSWHLSPNPTITDLIPTISNATHQFCRDPPRQREGFPRRTSVPAPFIAAVAHLPVPPCPSPPRRILPEIGPFHGFFTARVERCEHPIPGIVLGGLVPPPLRPTTTIRPHPPATSKPCTSRAGHRLGWAHPPLPPTPCTADFC